MSRHLLVTFETAEALETARRSLAATDLRSIETYTPTALSSEPASSPLSLLMLAAGVGGFLGFFALMAWADMRAYPLDIGGRPRFAWPAFVPIAFELGVLSAMIVGFVGWFVVCRRPKLYEPVDACASFPRASRDRWLLDLEAEPDALEQLRRALEPLHPECIEEYAP